MKRRAYLLAAALLGAAASLNAAAPAVVLPGHIPSQLRSAAAAGDVPADEDVALSLVVRVDRDLMERTLAAIYASKAPAKRHFLTSEAFSRLFDLPSKRHALKEFAEASGLAVDAARDSDRSLVVRAHGPARAVENAFGVRLRRYRSLDGQLFRSNDGEPSIPAALAPHIKAVLGLCDYRGAFKSHLRRREAPAETAVRPASLIGATGPSGLAPADIKTIYGIASNLDGSSQTIAIYELDGYIVSDVALYEQRLFPGPHPHPSVTCTSADGTCGLCGANQNLTCTARVAANDGGMAEVALDIDLAMAMAPGANLLIYTALNSNADALDAYADIASDDIAPSASTSWGLDEKSATGAYMASESAVFQQMAVQGQTLFAAAGDAGAYDGGNSQLLTDDPASQPYVVGVGGTSLSGVVGGGITETVWNNGCSSTDCSGGAGGGGVADYAEGAGPGTTTYWTIPSYQSGVATAYSSTDRNVPDVSLDADPDSGYSICLGGSCSAVYGGTSAAAPLWASFMALVNAQRARYGSGAVGFLSPILYPLAEGASYAAVFNDVTSGDNGFYSAGTGYDNATGWGSFRGDALIDALSGTNAVLPASPEFTDAGVSSITVNWSTASQEGGTLYTAQISSDAFADVLASSDTYGSSASFGTGGVGPALAPATAYAFRVQTTTTASPSAFFGLGQGYTLAEAPSAPSVLSVSSAAASLSWSAQGDPPGTPYELSMSTDGFNANVSTPIAFSARSTASSASVHGLAPSTAYAFRLRAANQIGAASPFSASASTQTRPAQLSSTTITASIGVSSIAWAWTLVPGATAYNLYDGAGGSLGSQTMLTLTQSALTPNTTYGLQVEGINANGPGPLAQAAARTYAAAPSSPVPALLSAAAAGLSWNAAQNPAGTVYILQASADPGFASGISSVTTTATTAAAAGLLADTTYYLRVRAQSGAAVLTSFTAPVAAATWAAAPSGLSYRQASSASWTFSWEPDGNPAATEYELSVSTDDFVLDFSTPLPFTPEPGGAFTLSSLAGGTTYSVRVRAENWAGVATAFSSAAYYRGTRAQQTVAEGAAASFTLGQARLSVPAGAFAQGAAIVLEDPGTYPPASGGPQALSPTGFGVEISAGGLQPLIPPTLTLGYIPGPWISDPARLVIAYHDDAGGVWVALPSTPDPASDSVSAAIPHFSTYQVMQADPAPSLAGADVLVYPNPFRPALGQSSVTFARLPAGAALRIYDILGEKVRELRTDASGMAFWDGRNAHGENAASGVYFVLAGSGSGRAVFKVAVVR